MVKTRSGKTYSASSSKSSPPPISPENPIIIPSLSHIPPMPTNLLVRPLAVHTYLPSGNPPLVEALMTKNLTLTWEILNCALGVYAVEYMSERYRESPLLMAIHRINLAENDDEIEAYSSVAHKILSICRGSANMFLTKNKNGITPLFWALLGTVAYAKEKYKVSTLRGVIYHILALAKRWRWRSFQLGLGTIWQHPTTKRVYSDYGMLTEGMLLSVKALDFHA